MERVLAEEFKELIKTVFVPRLKLLGFKKSNLNFNRSINQIVQCINVQKSQWNHRERITFTINLGLYNEKIFEISKNKAKQTNFVYENDCFVSGRTGHLIYNTDYWYELNTDTTYNDTSQRVESDLNEYVIPMFAKLETIGSLIELLRLDHKDRPFHLLADINNVAILELEFGEFNRGKELLVNRYSKAIVPRSIPSKTIYPDGKEEVRWSNPSINSFEVEKLTRIAKRYGIEL